MSYTVVTLPVSMLPDVVGIPATDADPGTPGIALEGGWGLPALSANGLAAFGLPEGVAVPDGLLALPGVQAHNSGTNWKSLIGWIEEAQ